MQITQWIRNASDRLSAAGIPLPLMEAEILIADLLNVDRAWLHAHDEDILEFKQLYILDQKIARRIQHEPLAYIRGFQEFYGRTFKVTSDTLTPRPETETMIEFALQHIQGHSSGAKRIQCIDIGTGSGCIIVTLAAELPNAGSFLGLDISKNALKVARTNAKTQNTTVDFQEFDLTKDSIHSLCDKDSEVIILANLPYVPSAFPINQAATHEPPIALFGGDDGLDYFRFMFQDLKNVSATVLTETLPTQHEKLGEIAEKNGYKLTKTQDLIQLFTSAHLTRSK